MIAQDEARQREIGDVRARNEQHEGGRSEKDIEWRARSAGEFLAHGLHPNRVTVIDRIILRISLRQLGADTLSVFRRLGRRYAILQSRENMTDDAATAIRQDANHPA